MTRRVRSLRNYVSSSRVWGCLSVVILTLTLVAESRATNIFWTNASGTGIFSTVSNWADIPVEPDRAPGPNDIARFGTPDGGLFGLVYTVSFTTSPTNQAFVVADDTVTFELDGNVYILTSLNPIILGTSSTRAGGLTITHGNVAVTSANAQLQLGAGGAGFLTVTTGGLLAGSAMDIYVGYATSSTLTINNNGDIVANNVTIGNNAAGTAMITGGGSSLFAGALTVSRLGAGTLNVTAGGQVDSSSGVIGDFPIGNGIVTVDGASPNGVSSKWQMSGDLFVGSNGSGTLNITNGGRVESSFATIGRFAGSVGTAKVEGAGSTWIVDFDLQVGNENGSGTLSIKAGGRVESMTGSIGDDGGMGTTNVEGLNSTWVISGRLSVAGGGSDVPNLNITEGGYVQDADGFIGSADGTGIANVDGAGSQWKNLGALSVGASGQGTLNITNGGLVLSVSAKVGDGSFSPGTVIVDGPGSR